MYAILAGITENCFVYSYSLALALECWHLLRPRPVQRLLAQVVAGAGWVANTVFLALNPGVVMTPFGSLAVLAWVLAIFYLYGSIHHPRVAWGLFVLPVVTGLAVLTKLAPCADTRPTADTGWQTFDARQFWPAVHGGLLLLAAVGVCVGFVASVMYLVQVRRLRAKLPPGRGLKLLSLERLETMNRHAVLLTFPLLSAGLLLGVVLLLHQNLAAWDSLKIFSTVALWLVFAILLYLRYAAHAGGRQLALLTIVAFALTLFALVSAHAFVP